MTYEAIDRVQKQLEQEGTKYCSFVVIKVVDADCDERSFCPTEESNAASKADLTVQR